MKVLAKCLPNFKGLRRMHSDENLTLSTGIRAFMLEMWCAIFPGRGPENYISTKNKPVGVFIGLRRRETRIIFAFEV